jgi:hypothetical protein
MQIDQTALIAILALLLVAVLVMWFLYRSRRTAALRDRFGESEYDRTLDARGGRGRAEADLVQREKRVAALDLRPLEADERARLTEAWHAAKARFVDDPAAAVIEGDKVIGAVMNARGYPVDDFDARFESLTVEHAEVARHYRAGHDIARKQVDGKATTEDLRQAMIHYEALFDELAYDRPDRPGGIAIEPARDRSDV